MVASSIFKPPPLCDFAPIRNARPFIANDADNMQPLNFSLEVKNRAKKEDQFVRHKGKRLQSVLLKGFEFRLVLVAFRNDKGLQVFLSEYHDNSLLHL